MTTHEGWQRMFVKKLIKGRIYSTIYALRFTNRTMLLGSQCADGIYTSGITSND